ncbi:hypothetical protein DFH06DRAFT_752086 [Mycena polygramma]|nr:hypothetical protein DFH06DRAFT_752086 [Mycena polygramma]
MHFAAQMFFFPVLQSCSHALIFSRERIMCPVVSQIQLQQSTVVYEQPRRHCTPRRGSTPRSTHMRSNSYSFFPFSSDFQSSFSLTFNHIQTAQIRSHNQPTPAASKLHIIIDTRYICAPWCMEHAQDCYVDLTTIALRGEGFDSPRCTELLGTTFFMTCKGGIFIPLLLKISAH